jgi:uncharacterized membrane protein
MDIVRNRSLVTITLFLVLFAVLLIASPRACRVIKQDGKTGKVSNHPDVGAAAAISGAMSLLVLVLITFITPLARKKKEKDMTVAHPFKR